MVATNPTRVELQNRFFIAAPQAQRRVTIWALVLLIVVVVATGLLLNQVFPLEQIDWEKVSRHAGKSLTQSLWDLALFVTVVVASLAQIVYLKRARQLERIILTEGDLRYQSALPKALQFLMPEWSAKWNEITRAYFRKKKGAYGPGAIELVLVTFRGDERKLRPYLWVDAEGIKPQSPWAALRRIQSMKPPELRGAILNSPVVQFARSRVPQLDTEASWEKVAFPFALETNRRALVALGLWAVLMIYGLADFVVNEETYAAQPPYAFFAICGLLAAVIAGLWLRGGDVPFADRMALAIVLGATFGAALYPGLLRINQLTDRVGLHTYLYQLQNDGTLEPLQDGPPVLVFPRYADYWSSFSAGSLHEFRLRKGGLDFYQVDMAPVNDAMRGYFRNQP
jgi:hypothetical protein